MKENYVYLKDLAKKTFIDFKNGTKTMFKEFFNKETNKKQRANMWTFIRLIIPIITLIMSICALSISSPILLLSAGAFAGFGAITDYFDGKSSRKYGSASEYGKLLDQVADKLFAGVVGINLAFLNPCYLIVLAGEAVIAAINVGYKIKYNDLNITSTKMGKIKEWPLFLTLALGFLSPISPTLLTISNASVLLTAVFQGLTAASYLEANNKAVSEIKRKNIIDLSKKITEEEDKEKELTLGKNKSRLEQYRDLKSILEQIAEKKSDEVLESGLSKTKKL